MDMANMIRRDDQQVARNRTDTGVGLGLGGSWDPFRMMDALLRWDPFRDVGGWTGRFGEGFVPRFDVKETKDGYLIRADLPGVKQSDLEISVTGNVLGISGHRSEEHREEGDQFHAVERGYGQFSRSFALPEGADLDNVKADLKDGVLTIHLAKRPEVQPRKISIGNGDQAKA
jgi:HSP20 family protein